MLGTRGKSLSSPRPTRRASLAARVSRRSAAALATLATAFLLASCAGIVHSNDATPPPISLVFSAPASTVQVSQTLDFAVTVQNDSSNRGVAWTMAGSGCSGAACGSLTPQTSTTASYRAPATVPSPATVTITATSVADSTKSISTTVTITAAPAAISVSVGPPTASVQVSTTATFTATIQNDSQNKGVTWSLSGTGCSGATCGSLTGVTATSAVYNAPANVPAPASVTITATSVADNTKSGAAAITVTAAPLPISVSVNPPSASVQVSTTANFAATLQNDSQNRGVTWSLSGTGCSGATCGSLTNIAATSVTYNAPATVPAPAVVSLTATSVADSSKKFAAVITVTAAPQPISVSVNPPTASVTVSTTQQFAATVQNDPANRGVTWQVNGVAGGTTTFGTVSVNGLYTAPATVPAPANFNVSAVSNADNTKVSSARVTVVAAPLPISVSIGPASASVQVSTSVPFTATVQNDALNKGVSWSLSGAGCSGATCGTLTSVTTTSVTYNAPANVPAPATVSLTATSLADGTKSASAPITITAAPAPISISVGPPTASVQVSATAPFTATVQNDSQNKGVTWSLSGAGCSGATCGTLTAVAATSATYKAPATVPTPATVTITATSVADGTKSSSATITVTPAPLPISVLVAPSTASVQVSTTSPFTATLQNDTQNKGVTWSLSGTGCSGATCGSLTNVTTTSVTYNAPATVPAPATVSLTATSVADGTKSSTSIITVTAAPLPISVLVGPATASVQVSATAPFTATLQNDSQNKGVTWALSGAGCSGATCGTLTAVTATSATYKAPATVPALSTVTITATSVADGTKSSSAIITVTPAPLPISVLVAPPTASVQVSTTSPFTATLQNDAQNKGVTWSLSGAGCSGATCGSLTAVTTTSVTYNAPAAVPSPATVTLTATSIADGTKSSSAVITVTAAPLPISVTLNPPSTSVQVSSTAGFSVTVQNDAQNKGVTFALSGAGCSGATCGTLTAVTATTVTYNAPATAPSPATVTLTATSVSDATKSDSSAITVTQPTGGSGVPTFAENHVSGSSTQGNTVSRYDFRLPNRTLAGNCVVVAFQYNNRAGASATVSDDKGNSYSTVATHNDGRQIVSIAVALNVAAGAQKISLVFSGGTPAFVTAAATEFYNIATANALDGSSGNDGASGTITAGSFTPANSGDLIYQYTVQDSSSDPMISWSQGSSPWTLLSADLLDGSAAQYQVQTSAGPINPTMGMSPSQNFSSLAIALKSANSGTPPPAGIRVVRVQHHSVQANASSPVRLQFPTTGNLIVLAWIGVPGHDLTGVSDGNHNTYTSTGAAFGNGLSGDSQIYYAASASTGTTLTGPNLTTTGSDISGSTATMLDIRGAAAAPFDSTAGLQKASAVQNSSGNVTGVTISPSTSNGLVVTTLGVDSNTINGVSPGNFLSSVPAPVSSPNPVDQNNGWALFYNATPGPLTFVWTSQGGPVDDWSSIAVAFKAQ